MSLRDVGGMHLERALEFVTLKYHFLGLMLGGSTMVGFTCGLLGCFLVLRRMSLMGDALGHASLPGVAVAFLIVQRKALLPLMLGAIASAMLAAFAASLITRRSVTRPDAALGMVMASFFGVGTALMSYLQNHPGASRSGLNDFLLGNAAAIQPQELWALGALAVVSLGLLVALYRPLQVSTFDPALAQAQGLPVRALHYGLMALVSVTIVTSIQSVGVILVAAMLITPAATAALWTHRLPTMLALSASLGVFSGAAGAMLSYVFDGFSSGPSMVLVASALYLVSFFLAPQRGALRRVLGAKEAA